jgi:ligand-binding sensor domain-containing protein
MSKHWILSRLALGLCLCGIVLVVTGCTAPQPTPTPLIPTATPTQTPTATPSPVPSPSPTVEAGPPRLEIRDVAIQYWSDPNDIKGLVHDGVYLWAATSGGVVRWQEDGTYRLYAPEDGLASLAVRGIAIDGAGHIWVGYADSTAWSKYDDEGWHTYATRQEAVQANYEAMLAARHRDPRLWYARRDGTWLWLPDGQGRLRAFDGQRWRTYTENNGVTRHTWMVVVSPAGRVWALGMGLSTAYEGEIWWTDHTLFSDITHWSQVTDLVVDDQEHVWLTFTGQRGEIGGLCRLELGSNSIRWRGHVQSVNPTILAQIHAMRIDSDGSIWLGGDDGIIMRQEGRPWKRLDLGPLTVRAFWRQREHLWLGTTRGVWRVNLDDDTREGPWQIPSPLVGHEVLALAEDQAGRLIIAMPHSLTVVEPDGLTRILMEDVITDLVTAPTGDIWIAAETGIHELVNGEPVHRFANSAVLLALDSDGVIYFCDAQGQLYVMLEDGPQAVADLYALIDAMPRNMVVDSEGTVWFSSENGLGGLKADGTFEHYTEDNGLLSRDVRSVAVGSEDTLWMATSFGLARRLSNGRFTRFTTQSTGGGLLSHDMWHVMVDADDVLWMTTAEGISYRTPDIDWANLELREARSLVPTQRGIWVGTPSGLYLVRREAITVLP